MISGFSGATRQSFGGYESGHGGGLPVPFNIPNVLHNLLFEDTGIEFDAKQSDMVEALRFSSNAYPKMQEKYLTKEKEMLTKMVSEPDNLEYKKEYEDIRLDILQANQHFKDLVIVLSELLTREQYAKLMEFSNIKV